MIEQEHPTISVARQCELFGISRSGLYYKAVQDDEDLQVMRLIDEQYMKTPFYGSRRMVVALRTKGIAINRKRMVRLMHDMGIEAIYPKPNLSVRNPEHKKYPYLLRGMKVEFPNQVWSADITYVPLLYGFGYLVAIIDWFSRYVISWEVSNLLDTEFCIEALTNGLAQGKPKIFNTDQGVQFTSRKFTGQLEAEDILVSMDGRGRALDNVFIERLWRSVKYEEIYPKEYEGLHALRGGLKQYFEFYNKERPHQSLNYKTPEEVYLKRS